MNNWNESDWFRKWLDLARNNMQQPDRNEFNNLPSLHRRISSEMDNSNQPDFPQWEVTE
jgi:hypothetical protein